MSAGLAAERAGARTRSAARLHTQGEFKAARARHVFQGRHENSFDVFGAKRLLLLRSAEQEAAPTQLHHVRNWLEELRRGCRWRLHEAASRRSHRAVRPLREWYNRCRGASRFRRERRPREMQVERATGSLIRWKVTTANDNLALAA
jgi:hypothetical protein